jgi:hypothetical protein
MPSEVTTRETHNEPVSEAGVFGTAGVEKAEPEAGIDVDSVFAKLKDLTVKE